MDIGGGTKLELSEGQSQQISKMAISDTLPSFFLFFFLQGETSQNII
jgi:hypothetical protein